MIATEFSSEHQVLKVIFSGRISKEEMLEYFQKVLNDVSMPRNLRILEDSREAEFGFDLFQNDEYRSLLVMNIQKFDSIKAAHVQTKVLETAYTLEFELRNDLPNFSFKVFYEYENALDWLFLEE